MPPKLYVVRSLVALRTFERAIDVVRLNAHVGRTLAVFDAISVVARLIETLTLPLQAAAFVTPVGNAIVPAIFTMTFVAPRVALPVALSFFGSTCTSGPTGTTRISLLPAFHAITPM